VRKLINNKEKHVIEGMSGKDLKNWIMTAESTNLDRFQYNAIRKNKWGI
jgi:hypothetical protein